MCPGRHECYKLCLAPACAVRAEDTALHASLAENDFSKALPLRGGGMRVRGFTFHERGDAMKRFTLVLTVVVIVLAASPSAFGDQLKPIPGGDPTYANASGTVSTQWQKVWHKGVDQYGHKYSWYDYTVTVDLNIQGLLPETSYSLYGYDTNGQPYGLGLYGTDQNGTIDGKTTYLWGPVKVSFSYYELWTVGIDPYGDWYPVELILSSQ